MRKTPERPKTKEDPVHKTQKPSRKTKKLFRILAPINKENASGKKTHMEFHINHTAENVGRNIISHRREIISNLLQMPLRKIHHEAPLPRQRNERPSTSVPELQTDSRRRWRPRKRWRIICRWVFESLIVDAIEIDSHQTQKGKTPKTAAEGDLTTLYEVGWWKIRTFMSASSGEWVVAEAA